MLEDVVTIFKRLTERQVYTPQVHVSIPMPSSGPVALNDRHGDAIRRQLRWAVGNVFLAGIESGARTIDTLATMVGELVAIALANADRDTAVEMLRLAHQAASHIDIDTADLPCVPPVEEIGQPGAIAFVDRLVEGGMQAALSGCEGVTRETVVQRPMLIGVGMMADQLGWNATMDVLAELLEYARDQVEKETPRGLQ
ncbi:hypothetical protein [Roseiterribacter gracilis]|uniref:Uncharacterized protein n=1 Tax=Roseiterribacter gracilis TaxID=2812848 RepID=A0A8S8XC72_9PROT|nr:hypothetical protein TMPK1_25210 [Rhodospirillales bacterium TMPK1]